MTTLNEIPVLTLNGSAEPTMEEIVEAIRRIVCEDNTDEHPDSIGQDTVSLHDLTILQAIDERMNTFEHVMSERIGKVEAQMSQVIGALEHVARAETNHIAFQDNVARAIRMTADAFLMLSRIEGGCHA